MIAKYRMYVYVRGSTNLDEMELAVSGTDECGIVFGKRLTREIFRVVVGVLV